MKVKLNNLIMVLKENEKMFLSTNINGDPSKKQEELIRDYIRVIERLLKQLNNELAK